MIKKAALVLGSFGLLVLASAGLAGCEGTPGGEVAESAPVTEASGALTVTTIGVKPISPITTCRAGDPSCGGSSLPLATDVAPDNGCSTSGDTTTCNVTFIHNGVCQTQTTTCKFDGTKNTCATTFEDAVPQATQCN